MGVWSPIAKVQQTSSKPGWAQVLQRRSQKSVFLHFPTLLSVTLASLLGSSPNIDKNSLEHS